MLDINRVLKEDRLLRALTGHCRKAFDKLLEAFCVQLNLEAIATMQKQRLRAIGGGRKARLLEFITRLLSVTEVMIDGTEQPIQPL